MGRKRKERSAHTNYKHVSADREKPAVVGSVCKQPAAFKPFPNTQEARVKQREKEEKLVVGF